jgi:NADH-quinone oxidoreductase subunit J
MADSGVLCYIGSLYFIECTIFAIVNLIVYAGAIMVLFLFVIMLMNLNSETEPRNKSMWVRMAGVISGGSLLLVMVAVIRQSANLVVRNGADKIVPKEALMKSGDIGLIENLGKVLFSDYVVPFEISSVLFLSAMVGAVVIGKKE